MEPDSDLDLEGMSQEQLVDEIKKLRAGIRQHRDAEGHSLCWWTPELWGLLPEKVDPKPRVPPVGEFLEKCAKYRGSLEASAIIAPMKFIPGKGLCFADREFIADPSTPMLPEPEIESLPETPPEVIESIPSL